jgi:hypothetical protein
LSASLSASFAAVIVRTGTPRSGAVSRGRGFAARTDRRFPRRALRQEIQRPSVATDPAWEIRRGDRRRRGAASAIGRREVGLSRGGDGFGPARFVGKGAASIIGNKKICLMVHRSNAHRLSDLPTHLSQLFHRHTMLIPVA